MKLFRVALVSEETRSAAFLRQSRMAVRQIRQYLLALKSGLMICMCDACCSFGIAERT